MHSAILIDRAESAFGLKRFLARISPDLDGLRILEKHDLLAEPEAFASIRYLFSTWNMPALSEREVSDFLPALEAVFYAAGDTAYFSDAFEKKGVRIFSARFENSIPVAEFVAAQVILANKGYFQAQDAYRRGFWRLGYRRGRTLSLRKPGNIGATVGIIGFGTIGSLVASKLQCADLAIVVYDPFVNDDKIEAAGAVRVGLEALFETCDVITNHLPDLPESRRLLRYEHFSAMKPDATFINTGRGRQVDEKGLARAMRECPTRSALLDVTRREPPDPLSPLYRPRNIFLSPHIAGSQGEEVERLYQAAFRHFVEHKASRAAG